MPDDPIVPYIQGDGIGAETWKAVQRVFEHSVEQCYGNAKRLEWLEVHAGERGNQLYGPNSWLPEDTIRAIQEYKVCIKGPLTTPVGAPKTLDAVLRERLDLFARVQPVRHIEGVPSPLVAPHGMDLMIFREHTEDLYSEIEWKKGLPRPSRSSTSSTTRWEAGRERDPPRLLGGHQADQRHRDQAGHPPGPRIRDQAQASLLHLRAQGQRHAPHRRLLPRLGL